MPFLLINWLSPWVCDNIGHLTKISGHILVQHTGIANSGVSPEQPLLSESSPKPILQLQVKEPSEFEQVCSQPPLLTWHSSISETWTFSLWNRRILTCISHKTNAKSMVIQWSTYKCLSSIFTMLIGILSILTGACPRVTCTVHIHLSLIDIPLPEQALLQIRACIHSYIYSLHVHTPFTDQHLPT